MNDQLRPVAALQGAQAHRLRRQPVGAPPRIAWLPIRQLVIDGSYQRAVSKNGVRLIRKLVEQWDWNRFKPLSVAPIDGQLYEVVDGQHTAIAAATHGAIELLPCMILEADAVAERAADFVGLNTTRTVLTPYAIFRGALVAGDPIALEVKAAMDEAGCHLVESVRFKVAHAVGTLACASLLMRIARDKGRDRLTRCLKAAVAAGLAPITSPTLMMLHGSADTSSDDQLITLARQCR